MKILKVIERNYADDSESFSEILKEIGSDKEIAAEVGAADTDNAAVLADLANEVPIVENPPLARALYAAVELDQEIPPEHYKAVAEVIGYVMRLKGKIASARRPA